MAAEMIRIGTAGWSLPRDLADSFPGEGSHLARYAARLNAVEINSAFYRPHRRSTYERWGASVAPSFRFAVKLPKAITHERRLADAAEPLDRFLGEIAGLGARLGPVLVQLPPSLAFDPPVAQAFFDGLRTRFNGQVACEPRHASWFGEAAQAMLSGAKVARVAADPAVAAGAAEPGGWRGLTYIRLHGSPRVYYSDYAPDDLAALAGRLQAGAGAQETWCIFDNTAMGCATRNALDVQARLAAEAALQG